MLRDCDNNDPTCEEVHFDPEGIQNEVIEARTSQLPLESNSMYEVFDISGKLIMNDNIEGIRNKLISMPMQMFIILEYDKNGS